MLDHLHPKKTIRPQAHSTSNKTSYILFHAGERFWQAPTVPDRCRFQLARSELAEIYRDMYREVASVWNWSSAISWETAQWDSHLAAADVEGHVLFVADQPAGWFELRHDTRLGSIEIYYLALRRQFIGCGLGRLLLRHAIGCAYRRRPRRVWLKTSSDDHLSALPLYLSESFYLIDIVPKV
ncbi:acetyltransferase, GNAT family [Candidatus Burkholderia humilis]|nr:acetyltransferase, GNAT family [Candidatus Burkholderia humilis]